MDNGKWIVDNKRNLIIHYPFSVFSKVCRFDKKIA